MGKTFSIQIKQKKLIQEKGKRTIQRKRKYQAVSVGWLIILECALCQDEDMILPFIISAKKFQFSLGKYSQQSRDRENKPKRETKTRRTRRRRERKREYQFQEWFLGCEFSQCAHYISRSQHFCRLSLNSL